MYQFDNPYFLYLTLIIPVVIIINWFYMSWRKRIQKFFSNKELDKLFSYTSYFSKSDIFESRPDIYVKLIKHQRKNYQKLFDGTKKLFLEFIFEYNNILEFSIPPHPKINLFTKIFLICLLILT